MPDPLDTIAAPVRTETEVKGSRFIADLVPVADLDAAETVIAAARREFHDARHHCTALVVGPDGQRRNVERFAVQVGHEDAGRLEHRLRTWAEATAGADVATGTYDADGVRFVVTALPEHVHGLETLLAESGLPHRAEELGEVIRAFRA